MIKKLIFLLALTWFSNSSAIADELPFEEEMRNLVGFCVVASGNIERAVASIERNGYMNESGIKHYTGPFTKKIGDAFFVARLFNQDDDPDAPLCQADVSFPDPADELRLLGASAAYLIFAKFKRGDPLGKRTIFIRDNVKVSLSHFRPPESDGDFTLALIKE